MTIAPLVNMKYLTIDAFMGVKHIKDQLIAHGSAIVMMEEEPVGLITPLDLACRGHNLIIDCLTEKPRLSPGIKITEALKIMGTAKSDTLAVYDGNELIGTLSKSDLIDRLLALMEGQSMNLQGVAHDLKRPLANMMGIFELLEDDFSESGNEELLSAAKMAYSNANNLINQLVKSKHTGLGAEQELEFNLREVLAGCIRDAEMALKNKQLILRAELPSADYNCKGHGFSIKRAIANILNNAIKFSDSGETIEIRTEWIGEELVVSIVDNGIGIPEEIMPHLFKRFSHSSRIGTAGESTNGLGLYITQNICKTYGIGLEVNSTEAIGTTFRLRFKSINR